MTTAPSEAYNRIMLKHAVITTPFPSSEKVARELGVSKRRYKELMKLADELIAETFSTSKKRSNLMLKRKSPAVVRKRKADSRGSATSGRSLKRKAQG